MQKESFLRRIFSTFCLRVMLSDRREYSTKSVAIIIITRTKFPAMAYYDDTPVQHAQAAKTINSKAAGRLLAAGGIYNGNIEGFHETAQQLGGDAPAGYDQVMDNKGLIIAGVSVAAGAMMGRMPVSELKEPGTTLSANGKAFSINELSQSGTRIDPAAKSGKFTVAGRALQKHGSREGSAFPAAKGNPAQMNEQGQQILDSIIRPPDVTVKEGNRFGGFDVISSDGKGSRFDSEGNFRGFFEP